MTQSIERADEQTTLPESWLVCKLADLVEFSKDKAAPDKLDADTRYIGLEHIEKDTGSLIDYGTAEEVRSTKSRFKEGELLYGKLRPYLNKVHVAEFEGICSTDILVLRTLGGVYAKYLHYRLLSKDFVEYANKNVSGVQHPRVNSRTVSQFDVELPPLNEQRGIVEKIEELFTKLDAGVRSLKQTQALLGSYRSSVLKAAVEGELSREWREAHKDELEPASELLERILQERREKFAGKKYKEPASPDTSELPTLPDGWEWASADQLTSVVTDGEHITPERSTSGVPLLSARNVQNGWLSFEKVDYVPESVYEILTRRLVVEPGDVLMSCSGTVGRSCVAPKDSRFALVRSVAVLKPLGGMGKFLSYSLRSPLLQSQIHAKKTQTAQANIFQGKIRTLVFALPPLAEQRFIVEEVERRLSVVDKLEATVEASLKQAGALRQSILKRAFSGELVPQYPDDEPASVLLERIREEHQAAKPKARKGPKGSIDTTKRAHAEQEGLF